MPKVNLKALFSELNKAEPFTMLEMNAGTSYLFDAVYKRLAYEETVYLKDLDFSRFNLDDIVSLQNIYNDTIETNAVRSRGITDAMAKAGSVSVAVSFV